VEWLESEVLIFPHVTQQGVRFPNRVNELEMIQRGVVDLLSSKALNFASLGQFFSKDEGYCVSDAKIAGQEVPRLKN